MIESNQALDNQGGNSNCTATGQSYPGSTGTTIGTEVSTSANGPQADCLTEVVESHYQGALRQKGRAA